MTTRLTANAMDCTTVAQSLPPGFQRFLAPVSSGLLGWYFLGGGSSSTVLVDQSGQGSLTLAPGGATFNTGYTSFLGVQSQGIDTTVAETFDLTLLCVARSSDTFASQAHSPLFITSVGADTGSAIPGTKGTNFCVWGVGSGGAPAATIRLTNSRISAGANVTSSSTILDVGAINSFQFFSASVTSATGANAVSDTTNAKTATNTPDTNTRIVNSQQKFRIGGGTFVSGGTATLSGTCDIAFAAIYNRALAASEITTIYQFMQNYLSRKYAITI